MDPAIIISKLDFTTLLNDGELGVWLGDKELVYFPYRGWPDEVAVPVVKDVIPPALTDLGKKFRNKYVSAQQYLK